MTFGVRTWSAGGTLELDTDSFTYQVLHNQVYQLNGSNLFTVPIPGFVVATCVAAILPVSQPVGGDLAVNAMPYMTVANGAVTIRSRNPSEPNSDPSFSSKISFRLLAMRYAN